MPAAQAPRTVDAVVKAVNGDVRKFARCLERARVAQTPEDVSACLRQLDGSKRALQEHRAQLRQRVAELGAKGAGKDKLGAARTAIEQELRKLQDFERKMEAALPKPPCGGTAEKHASKVESPPQTPATASGAASSSSDSGEERGEVKVLKTQLLRGQADDEDVTKEFVCKICLDVVGCAPKLTRCAHLFCGDCIKQWFAVQPKSQTWAGRAKATGTVPCPVCKEPLHEQEDLHAVCPGQRGNSAFLWKMLSGLEVRCANHPSCNPDGRCDWTGTYGDYQAHIQCCENEPLRGEPAAEVFAPDAAPMQLEHLHQEVAPWCEAAAIEATTEPPEQWDDEDLVAPFGGEFDPTCEDLKAPEVDAAAAPPEHADQPSLDASVGGAPDAAYDEKLEALAAPEPAVIELVQPMMPLAAPPSSPSPVAPQAATKKTKQQKKAAKAAAAATPGAADAAPPTDPAALAAAAAAGAAAQAAQLAAAAAQRQAYAQQLAQWQAAQTAQQMAYAARMQAVQQAARNQMAYAAQCQAAYAAQYQAAYAARAQAAAAALCGR